MSRFKFALDLRSLNYKKTEKDQEWFKIGIDRGITNGKLGKVSI